MLFLPNQKGSFFYAKVLRTKYSGVIRQKIELFLPNQKGSFLCQNMDSVKENSWRLCLYINLPDGSFECEMCGTGTGGKL